MALTPLSVSMLKAVKKKEPVWKQVCIAKGLDFAQMGWLWPPSLSQCERLFSKRSLYGMRFALQRDYFLPRSDGVALTPSLSQSWRLPTLFLNVKACLKKGACMGSGWYFKKFEFAQMGWLWPPLFLNATVKCFSKMILYGMRFALQKGLFFAQMGRLWPPSLLNAKGCFQKGACMKSGLHCKRVYCKRFAIPAEATSSHGPIEWEVDLMLWYLGWLVGSKS